MTYKKRFVEQRTLADIGKYFIRLNKRSEFFRRFRAAGCVGMKLFSFYAVCTPYFRGGCIRPDAEYFVAVFQSRSIIVFLTILYNYAAYGILRIRSAAFRLYAALLLLRQLKQLLNLRFPYNKNTAVRASDYFAVRT
jgi:hypothetical protein